MNRYGTSHTNSTARPWKQFQQDDFMRYTWKELMTRTWWKSATLREWASLSTSPQISLECLPWTHSSATTVKNKTWRSMLFRSTSTEWMLRTATQWPVQPARLSGKTVGKMWKMWKYMAVPDSADYMHKMGREICKKEAMHMLMWKIQHIQFMRVLAMQFIHHACLMFGPNS